MFHFRGNYKGPPFKRDAILREIKLWGVYHYLDKVEEYFDWDIACVILCCGGNISIFPYIGCESD